MNEREDNFDWKPLGEAWWRKAAEDLPIAVSEKQLRFAVAKHRGCSDIESARQSGYAGSKESLKQAAYKAARTNAVVQLRAFADFDGPVPSQSKLVDDSEIQEILSKQIRSGDPNTVIRASELYNKIKERSAERGLTEEEDGFSDWRLTRSYLTFPGGAAAWIHLWSAQRKALSALDLLHDVYRECMKQDPELWQRKVRESSPAEQAWLQRLLENPDWQRDARIKIWKEIGIDIESSGESPQSASPKNEQTVAIQLNGDIVGHDYSGDSAWREESEERAEQ